MMFRDGRSIFFHAWDLRLFGMKSRRSSKRGRSKYIRCLAREIIKEAGVD